MYLPLIVICVDFPLRTMLFGVGHAGPSGVHPLLLKSRFPYLDSSIAFISSIIQSSYLFIRSNIDPKLTSISIVANLSQVPCWLTYDFPPDVREKLRHQWGSDWKGQAQKWFLFKFTGKDEEINLLGDGSEKPEFGEWSWLSPEEIINLAVDFKKPVYQEVFTAFSPHLE